MKAKNLRLGDPVYRVEVNRILILRVKVLKMYAGLVYISLNSYLSEAAVKPDAEAIINPENPAHVRYYFDLKSAQLRQLRERNDIIEFRQKALQEEAERYSDALKKYRNVPPSEPVEL